LNSLIFVVDDDLVLLQNLRRVLEVNNFDVIVAPNGKEALSLISTIDRVPEIIISDILMPEIDGYDFFKIVSNNPILNHIPFIFLSGRNKPEDVRFGKMLGVDDYLTKPFAFSELLARVQALIRRSSDVAEPTKLVVGEASLNLITREVVRAGRKIDLQPLEFSLLEYLMRNAGRVVSKTMIMEHVWDYYFDPQTNVVESRIYRLREKFDKGFAGKMIHTIRGVGYVLKEENS